MIMLNIKLDIFGSNFQEKLLIKCFQQNFNDIKDFSIFFLENY